MTAYCRNAILILPRKKGKLKNKVYFLLALQLNGFPRKREKQGVFIMAVTISIFNQKGGVGKSTTASNLMAGLQLKKKKVLGIDIDPQGNLTKLCGVNTEDENTVLELLAGDATFIQTVKPTAFGDLLPSDRNLAGYERQFVADVSNVYAMKDIIEKNCTAYDFIIIDCPPNAGMITMSALIASNYAIVPSEAEYFSLDGVNEIAKTVDSAKKRLNPNLQVLGVLLIKYQPRRILTRKIESTMQRLAEQYLHCGLFETKIGYSVAIPESQAARQSIFEYDAKSKIAKAYLSFAEEVVTGVKKNG